MIRHYLKMAIRNLSRNKVFSLINILGLAVGMGVCLLIYQYVHFELSYDRFHINAQNTYRLTQTTIRNGEDLGTGVFTTYALGVKGKENIPEIEDFVRIYPQQEGMVFFHSKNNESYQEDGICFVDRNFLHMFDFPLKYGDRNSPLDNKYSIVLTEQMAIKYFGDANPLGKTLKISFGWASGDYVVTAVLKALPANSHLQFDFLLPINLLLENDLQYKEDDGWAWTNFVTYVRINKTSQLDEVGEKFNHLIDKQAVGELTRSKAKWKIGFQPITDIHLKSKFPRDLATNNGDIQNVWFFSIIALFTLLIAWINYINLSTACAVHRAKEVGVRKSMGALKNQLMSQFMVESAMVNFMAIIAAIGIAYLMVPVLNNIIGKELAFNVLQNLNFWIWFSVIIILGLLLSGFYPAFVLSSFKPVSVLKSANITSKRGLNLRKGLIVFQFLISALLISGTYLVYKQVTFMKHHDLGIDIEKILILNGPLVFLETLKAEGATIGSKYQAFKKEVASHYSISSVTATSSIPSKGYFMNEGMWRLGEPEEANKKVRFVLGDVDFTDTYNFEFLSGERFSAEMFGWKWGIINEEAVKILGLGSPEEALNETLVFFGDTVKIQGVVKNAHWSSLRDAFSPTLFLLDNEWGVYFSIKMKLSDIQETITHLESAYKSVFPGDPFDYFFLDDHFNRQYQADLQFQNLFTAFSLLAIFIACLGLFALVSFSATLKIKEIGVRKVLGASVGNLMLLLSKEYLLLLSVAVVLAVPVVIFGAGSWLENYAYRIDIGLDLLIIPVLILFLIALMTVSYRTYVTASANPVDSLKSE